MDNYECGILDDSEINDYEKGLYDAFISKSPNRWIMDNYKKIDGNRLQSIIPYEYQRIYNVKKDGKLLLSTSVNLKPDKINELELMGFPFVEKNDDGVCEALSMFFYEKNVKDLKVNTLEAGSMFFKYVKEDLKKTGIKKMYGSCTDNKMLRKLYKVFGFKELSSIEIFGVPEFYLVYEL
jgi:hypothetical protein